MRSTLPRLMMAQCLLSLATLSAGCASRAPAPPPPDVVVKTKVEYAPLPAELLRPGRMPDVPIGPKLQSGLVPYIVQLEAHGRACEIDRAAVAGLYAKWTAEHPAP